MMNLKKILFYLSLITLMPASAFSQATEPQTPSRSIRSRSPLGRTLPTVVEPSVSKENVQLETPLAPFGYNLFKNSAVSFDLQASTLLSSDYRLGPGDRLGLHLGGKNQENYEVMVSADGQIFLPTAGILQVNGLTMRDFRKLLEERLRNFYKQIDLEIILLVPKNILVSVIGEVNAPGNYVMSGLHTPLDAMNIAQGPTEQGSLRNVQIFRSDSLVANVDLYDFLLRPKAGASISLQSGDRIFVPVARSRIEIVGEIHRQAIYELNPHSQETLCDLIDLAGGFTDLAHRSQVVLSRLDSTSQRAVWYFDLENENCSGSLLSQTLLRNDDQIVVFSKEYLTPAQFVSIFGEVNKPGKYPFEKNMRIGDLILRAQGLSQSAYLLEAEIAKVDPKTPLKSLKFDLQEVLQRPNSEDNLLLEADDQVFIRPIPEWQVGPLVQIKGEVKFAGHYAISKDSTRLSEIIRKAGGFNEEVMLREAKLLRNRTPVIEDKEFDRLKNMTREEMSDLEYDYFVMRLNTEEIREIVVDFYRLFVLNDPSEDVILEDGDEIIVPKKPKVVFVSGRVARPGGVLVHSGMNVKYYLSKAGGLVWDADKRRIKVVRTSGEIIDDEDVKKLEAGDRIWVPRRPERNYWQIFRDTILVAGQIATISLVVRNSLGK